MHKPPVVHYSFIPMICCSFLLCMCALTPACASLYADRVNTDEKTDRRPEPQKPLPIPKRPVLEMRVPPLYSPFDTQKRVETNLTKAQAAYDAIKGKTPYKADYVSVLVDLADAVYQSRDKHRASKIYSDAFKSYLTLTSDPVAERKARASLWKHLGFLPAEEFETDFNQLFKKALEVRNDRDRLDGHIAQAMADRSRTWKNPPFDEMKFLKNAIDIQSSIEGQNSPNLEYLLRCYSEKFEQRGELDRAESLLKQITGLNPSRSPNKTTAAKIDLEQFYVRHKMYDKADQYWQILKNSPSTSHNSGTSSEYLRLAETYLNDSHADEAEKVLSKMLEAADQNSIYDVDRLLEKMVVGQINSGNLEKAHKLLSMRTAASKRWSEDTYAHQWFLKLSDLDLAMGKTEASQKLFEQVKIHAALRNENIDKLVENRQKLITTLKK